MGLRDVRRPLLPGRQQAALQASTRHQCARSNSAGRGSSSRSSRRSVSNINSLLLPSGGLGWEGSPHGRCRIWAKGRAHLQQQITCWVLLYLVGWPVYVLAFYYLALLDTAAGLGHQLPCYGVVACHASHHLLAYTWRLRTRGGWHLSSA